jgi:hypothetical protein
MIRKLLAVFVVALLGGFVGARVRMPTVLAQSPNVYQITGAWVTHTACTPTVGQTTSCLVSDGLWISVNGGAFTRIDVPVAAGVTSWNGQTGVVVYAPPASPVVSVNGKTGAVVLNATTTAPTTTIN